MTYVASPKFSPDPAARKANLQQCLDVARRRLDEISGASETEKNALLTTSAVAAGWDESEVADLLNRTAGDFAKRGSPGDPPERLGQQPRPLGLVPSSSL
jgi:hypothetical protein